MRAHCSSFHRQATTGTYVGITSSRRKACVPRDDDPVSSCAGQRTAMSSSSEEVVDESRGAASATTVQLEGCSPEERQDLQQRLAMGICERRPDAPPNVLGAACTSSRRSRSAPPASKAPPDMRKGQAAQVCLRREVPTDHEARSTRSGTAAVYALSQTASAGCTPGNPNEGNAKDDRIHTQA